MVRGRKLNRMSQKMHSHDFTENELRQRYGLKPMKKRGSGAFQRLTTWTKSEMDEVPPLERLKVHHSRICEEVEIPRKEAKKLFFQSFFIGGCATL